MCIVQDDFGDWEKEASNMGSIYQHAHLNIAANWTDSSDDGFFFSWQTAPIVTLEGSDGHPTSYILRHHNFYTHDIVKAPLNE